MKKDILANAVRLADKSTIRPDKAVIAKPGPALFVKKPASQVLSERLYTRVTPGEMKRLKARIRGALSASQLLRHLLTQYLDSNDE